MDETLQPNILVNRERGQEMGDGRWEWKDSKFSGQGVPVSNAGRDRGPDDGRLEAQHAFESHSLLFSRSHKDHSGPSSRRGSRKWKM
jgi:hypothetical protein